MLTQNFNLERAQQSLTLAKLARSTIRQVIVEVALSWIGTPFVDGQGVKHCGVDCAYFPIRVCAEAGVAPDFCPVYYSPQLMLHSREERYVETVLLFAREIAESEVDAADLVLYKVGRSFSHGAIVVDWPEYVLHPVPGLGVIGSHGLEEGFLRRRARDRRYFTLWD